MHQSTLTETEHMQPKCPMHHSRFAPLLHISALFLDSSGGNGGFSELEAWYKAPS